MLFRCVVEVNEAGKLSVRANGPPPMTIAALELAKAQVLKQAFEGGGDGGGVVNAARTVPGFNPRKVDR